MLCEQVLGTLSDDKFKNLKIVLNIKIIDVMLLET